ncbi:ninja-family protein mc410 [Punica granatum]|uniref:Ninja-family protein n=1 Tax=Punica granatum TaxID=22663 RepID=A0A218VZX4_PUNGR|nr:ninja-family protein mc410 [Punica granatum]OWM66055.1 hypothetical protein CDL15_Pgr015481 [Punica granatum]
MEDENGLELSLGLSCGGSSGKEKGKSGTSNIRAEDSDRGSKIVNDFKNFLNPGMQRHESAIGSQGDLGRPSENFFNDLSKTAPAPAPDAGASSLNLGARNLWVGGNYRPAATEDEKGPEPGNKRKMLYDEINQQKRHETEAHADGQDKNKTLHISITTEDGSTVDNEDVADSEIEGSTSRLVASHDVAKRYTPEFQKEIQGQKRLNHDNEFKVGNSGYGVPFAVQPMHMMNGSSSVLVKDANTIGAPAISGHSLPGLIQVMPGVNGDRSEAHPASPANLPVMFGYSPVQLPTLDKDNSWGLVSHGQQLHSPYTASMQVLPRTLPEMNPHNGKTSELSKAEGKNILEEGSPSQNDEKAKGKSERPTSEGLTVDFSAIKPGIAADVKFGGCGSYPNLPWVSTTAPNGRTISGVTYKYNANQIRIVCACHGSHLSPEEFVRHAAEDHSNPDGSNGMPNFPSKNPAASAQS